MVDCVRKIAAAPLRTLSGIATRFCTPYSVPRTKKQRASRGLPAELKGPQWKTRAFMKLAWSIVCTTNWAERLEAATCYRSERYELTVG
jgi:hypothetical protein